ncbi:unnamed protein product [Haemonchus placei]|uniref:pyruvate kinase n=1 Tax=Haemonchus placei TaxID=6290 RepID=A0A0N4X4R6_HAEPC|nr:unnamed protein product [Haemonchus placei]
MPVAVSPYHDRTPNYDLGHFATYLEHLCQLNVADEPAKHRKTAIICTVGPACSKLDLLKDMITQGMNIARLNFSHGSHEEHAKTIALLREAAKGHVAPLAIALDTKGPEIRTGMLHGGKEVTLKQGDTIYLSTDPKLQDSSTATSLYVDYKNLPKVVHEQRHLSSNTLWKVSICGQCKKLLLQGGRIFIDDGLISLTVKEIGSDSVMCEIENGGVLGNRKVSL